MTMLSKNNRKYLYISQLLFASIIILCVVRNASSLPLKSNSGSLGPSVTNTGTRLNRHDHPFVNSDSDRLIEGSGAGPPNNTRQKYDATDDDDDDDDDDEDYEDYKDSSDSGSGNVNGQATDNVIITPIKPIESDIYNPFRAPAEPNLHVTISTTTMANPVTRTRPTIANISMSSTGTPVYITTKVPLSSPSSINEIKNKNNDTRHDTNYDYEEDEEDDDLEEASAFEDNDSSDLDTQANIRTNLTSPISSSTQEPTIKTQTPSLISLPNSNGQANRTSIDQGRSKNQIGIISPNEFFNKTQSINLSSVTSSIVPVSNFGGHIEDDIDKDDGDEDEDEEDEDEEGPDDSDIVMNQAIPQTSSDQKSDAKIQASNTYARIAGTMKQPTLNNSSMDIDKVPTPMQANTANSSSRRDNKTMQDTRVQNTMIPTTNDILSTKPVPSSRGQLTTKVTSKPTSTPTLILPIPSTTVASISSQSPSHSFTTTTRIYSNYPLYPPSTTVPPSTQFKYTTPRVYFTPATSTNLSPYDREMAVMNDDGLTRQIYDKTIELYQETERSLKRAWDFIWPPNFDSTNFEPLLAQPMFFMFALAGAVMGLVLLMMLVVYIITYQIQPRDIDDISIY